MTRTSEQIDKDLKDLDDVWPEIKIDVFSLDTAGFCDYCNKPSYLKNFKVNDQEKSLCDKCATKLALK